MAPNHVPKPLFPSAGKNDDATGRQKEPEALAPKKPVPQIKPLFPTSDSTKQPISKTPVPLSFQGAWQRKRIPVTLQELRDMNQDVTDDSVYQRVLDYIHVLNPEESDFSIRIQSWGEHEQIEFANICQEVLNISTNDDLDKVRDGIANVTTLIKETNIEVLFNQEQSLFRFWKTISFDSAKQTLLRKLNEIDTATKNLRNKIPVYETAKKSILLVRSRLREIIVKLEASLVSCRFLHRYLTADTSKPCYADWCLTLEKRIDSLSVSRLAALQSEQQTHVMENNFKYVQDVVQNIFVTLIPVWNTNCVAVLTRARNQKESPQKSILDSLLDNKHKILSELDTIRI